MYDLLPFVRSILSTTLSDGNPNSETNKSSTISPMLDLVLTYDFDILLVELTSA